MISVVVYGCQHSLFRQRTVRYIMPEENKISTFHHMLNLSGENKSEVWLPSDLRHHRAQYGMHKAPSDGRLHERNITPVGVDIAKNVIQVHFIDENTGADMHLHHPDFLTFFSNRGPEIDEGHARE